VVEADERVGVAGLVEVYYGVVEDTARFALIMFMTNILFITLV